MIGTAWIFPVAGSVSFINISTPLSALPRSVAGACDNIIVNVDDTLVDAASSGDNAPEEVREISMAMACDASIVESDCGPTGMAIFSAPQSLSPSCSMAADDRCKVGSAIHPTFPSIAFWAAVGIASTTGLDTNEDGSPSITLGFATASCELHTDDCGIQAAGYCPLEAASQVPVRPSRVTLASAGRTSIDMQRSRATGSVALYFSATVLSGAARDGSLMIDTARSPSTHRPAAS